MLCYFFFFLALVLQKVPPLRTSLSQQFACPIAFLASPILDVQAPPSPPPSQLPPLRRGEELLVVEVRCPSHVLDPGCRNLPHLGRNGVEVPEGPVLAFFMSTIQSAVTQSDTKNL